ncbi:MAG TPA: DUF2020 domain-containing protein [Pseudonocardiaceae bacterium]|nr:DUF2020 domain-containing protein [Pseudonocardiaceae bacterium]
MSPASRRRPITTSPRWKLITMTSAAGVLVAAVVGCGHPTAGTNTVSPAAAPPVVAGPLVPPAPQPVAEGPCRYLSAALVQAANGERVAKVRVSTTGTDQPYPACFFLTANGTVQLRTWIVVGTTKMARATVDSAAPVNTSDLAGLPGGWSGGSQPTAEGAVFAVARQGTAVVITTNQHQTISARQIAQQVITTLRL